MEAGSLLERHVWCIRLEIVCMKKIIINKIRCKKCATVGIGKIGKN